MASHDYRFRSQWRVPGHREEVYDLLSDAEDLVRWWPSVYLRVTTLRPGRGDGLGREVELDTRGWLPYRLRWSFRVTEVNRPQGFALEAWGDFVGRGRWSFVQVGPEVDIVYDWEIRAEKPLLRRLSWLLKPLFSANHRWAMAQGERSLRSELARRHEASATMDHGAVPSAARPDQ